MDVIKHKKSIVIILLTILIISCGISLRAEKAEALGPEVALAVPVGELYSVPFEAKEGPYGTGLGGFDTFAYWIAKVAINTITNSIVNWINSGFEGSPSFVTNPDMFLGDLAEQATGVFIQQMGLTRLCSPFWLPQLKFALTYSAPYVPRIQCTLTDVIENVERFENDFMSGGWDTWLSMTMQPQNNIFGAYFESAEELARRQAAARERGKTEVNWGSGFVSLKECQDGKSQEDTCIEICDNSTENYGEEDEDWNQCHEECMADEMGTSELCEMSGGSMQNTTPGKVIADQLNLALGSPIRQGELADEANEAIAAIINALINQLVQGGLRSLSGEHGESGDWYKTPSSSNETGAMTGAIDTAISLETQYRDIKQKSINAYNDAIAKIYLLKKCYENLGGMQDVIDNQLVPLINDLTNQKRSFETAVQNANYLIGQAKVLKTEIEVVTNGDKLEALLKEFRDELQPRMHTNRDIINADSEYKNVVKPAIDDILNGSGGINSLYQQCLQDLSAL